MTLSVKFSVIAIYQFSSILIDVIINNQRAYGSKAPSEFFSYVLFSLIDLDALHKLDFTRLLLFV